MENESNIPYMGCYGLWVLTTESHEGQSNVSRGRKFALIYSN